MTYITVDFLKNSKTETQCTFREKKMRLETYEEDLVLKDTKLTGIKEKSVWDEVLHFRSVENHYGSVFIKKISKRLYTTHEDIGRKIHCYVQKFISYSASKAKNSQFNSLWNYTRAIWSNYKLKY